MEQFYMNNAEAFDLQSSEDIRKKKSKKVFKVVLIMSLIVFVILLVFLCMLYEEKEEEIPVTYKKEEIQASGQLLRDSKTRIYEEHAKILENKKEYIRINDNLINNDFIRNNTYVVYRDGTYNEIIQEVQGRVSIEKHILGKINLEGFEKYIDDKKEIINSLEIIDYENSDDDFVEGDSAMVYCDNSYRLCYKGVDTLYDALFSLYLSAEKEEIQNYNLEDKN